MDHPSQGTFEGLGLRRELAEVALSLGYVTPTPIQLGAIPPLLGGRDVIGAAQTGSGKTAAFALPLLQGIVLESGTPQVLVLVPTRELSAQVAAEFRKLGRGLHGLKVVELTGGTPARPQRESLERGAHVAIGTPGRVQDHLERGALNPVAIGSVVLDEADRMLDMGFGPDVRRVLRFLPARRRAALFSATFPEAIEAMASDVLRDPVFVTGNSQEISVPDIDERYQISGRDRFPALCAVLAHCAYKSAIVFCNLKATVAQVASALDAAGIRADRLDGDLEQFQRDQVLARFRGGSLSILVATDVAARGIDIDALDMVVNYELPPKADSYVHRIGRTGRAGESGLAVSLATRAELEFLQGFERTTGRAISPLLPKDHPHHSAPPRDPGALLARLHGGATMESILVSGGRKDKVRPGDIVGALTGEAGGLPGSAIGKIEVRDTISYVAVQATFAERAVESLNRGRIKGKKYRATLTGSTAHGKKKWSSR